MLPVPTAVGKGVLVSPTIYGNVMLGPTAEDLDGPRDTVTSEAGFEFLLDKGRGSMPTLLDEEVTATYAGLRAATDHDDYLIDVDPTQRYVLVGGIRSTGLTAAWRSPSTSADCSSRPGSTVPPRRPAAAAADAQPRRGLPAAVPGRRRIAGRPGVRPVVCFCERVTRGEIRDAFASTIPPSDLDGLRRRTRALNGRCQGFFCGAEVSGLLATSATGARRVTDAHADVVVVGAGPPASPPPPRWRRSPARSWCSTARREAGGIPRHSDHLGYGMRDLRRSSPARRTRAGSSRRRATPAPTWHRRHGHRLGGRARARRHLARGRRVIDGGRGRARHRCARAAAGRPGSIPGDRPDGVLTTGQLQNLVHLQHREPSAGAPSSSAPSWSAGRRC